MSDKDTPIALKVPPQGFVELEQLASNPDKLQPILSAIGALRLNTPMGEVVKLASERVGLNAGVTRQILGGLANLRTLMLKLQCSPKRLVESITFSISSGDDTPYEWLEKNFETWQRAEPAVSDALESISDDHHLLLRAKANELTYVHQNIFKLGRIITDLRPVFTGSGKSIEAIVLTHVLSIEYFDGVRDQRIEFALDESDVEDLQKMVERARIKTETTRQRFSGDEWALVVAGEPTSANKKDEARPSK